MSLPKQYKVYILSNPPTDKLASDTFKVETRTTPSPADLKDGEVIVKVTALSNDPAQRTWIDPTYDPARHYAPPVNKGDPVRCRVMGTVAASKSSNWNEGDKVVIGSGSWSEYIVTSDSMLGSSKAISIPNQSEFIPLSLFGTTGLTAYAGVYKEMELKPEHVVVVSGAAGAVGSAVIQIAKRVIKCRKVVGIAGGKEKCDWVKSLGADECIDYKDKDYQKHLKSALPDYADRYFDNVGGEILDTMLSLVKRHGMISVCGAISSYNEKGVNFKNWFEVVANRLNVKGFIVIDYLDIREEFVKDMAQWLKDGVVQNADGETVVEAKFEDIPNVWERLFEGGNRGKLITKIV